MFCMIGKLYILSTLIGKSNRILGCSFIVSVQFNLTLYMALYILILCHSFQFQTFFIFFNPVPVQHVPFPSRN